MNDIRKVLIIALGFALIGYTLGRYIGTSTSSSTEVKVDEKKDTETQQHKVITEVKKPDGTITIVTTVDTVKNTQESKDTDTKTVVTKSGPKTNISALIGTSIHDPLIPAYGVSFNREFIGPFTLVALGMTNGIIGISIGVNF